MNKKLHNTYMILLLIVTTLVLAACGTLRVEQVEPVTEETAVSSTPSLAIAAATATATAIPPTPIIEVLPPMNVAHSSGDNETIVLPGCFDFDNGVSLPPPDLNCDFTLLPGPDSGTIEMYPITPAALAYGGVFSDVPTIARCAGSDAFSTEPEVVAPLAAMYVCYRTREGRVGYLHFTEVDLEQAYTVTLEWLTFSDELTIPNQEDEPATPVAYNGGSDEIAILPACFDFDNGLSLAPPDPNCDFNLLPGSDSGTIEIYPIAPAQLAYGSVFPETPTFAQCAGNDAFSTEPAVVTLSDALFSVVCYRTGENRVGYLHFTDADLEQAYSVTLEWLTFSDEQGSGTNLEEMNLAYQNNIFGFTLPLPEAWQGYTVTQNDYEGVTNFCFTFIGSVPTCILQIDVYSQVNWENLEKVPDGYYLAENNQFVFAAGPHQEECVQLDEFQCARYQEIPTILAGFNLEQ
jgi:hypothetical protein